VADSTSFTYQSPAGLNVNFRQEGDIDPARAVTFEISLNETLIGYPLGPLGPLGSLDIGIIESGSYESFLHISKDWENPVDGSSNGTVVLGFSAHGQQPDGNNGTVRVLCSNGVGQSTGPITFTGSMLCAGISSGDLYPPGNGVMSLSIEGPSGAMTWTTFPSGDVPSVDCIQFVVSELGYGSESGTISMSAYDPGPESISLYDVHVNYGTPINLGGTNFIFRATAMDYQIDGAGDWHPVTQFAQGYTWTGVGPAALTGTHTLQVRDANIEGIVSNTVTYTIDELFLNTPAGFQNTPLVISGTDLEAILATGGLQYQFNGVGDWLDVGAYVPVQEPGETWTGIGPTEPEGVYTLQVRNTAHPDHLSNVVTYTVAAGGILDIPVWSLEPDWQGGVLERLEWLTAVMTGDLGAEQRVRVRLSPRRTLEMQYVLIGRLRTLYDLALKSQGSSDWYVPNWTDIVRLPNAVGPTQTLIEMPTAGHDYAAGGLAILYSDAFTYEICIIGAVTDQAVTLYTGPENTWKAGTRFMPVIQCDMTDEPQATRYADRSVVVTVGWMSKTAQDFSDDISALDTFLGWPVLTDAPDETTDMTYQFQRIKNVLDPTMGKRVTVDSPGYGFGSQQYNWFVNGYASNAVLRSLLYYLSGKLKPIWVPTFFADLDLIYDIGAADSTLTVAACGFTAYSNGAALQGRQNIRIELYSGSSYYRTITGSAAAGSQEVLEIMPLGAAVPRSAIRRISFMSLCRQDTDQIEIEHNAAGGVCTISTTFREAPDIRRLVYTVLDLAKTTAGLLGQGGATYRLTGTDTAGLSKSVSSQTAGKYYLEAVMGQGFSGYGRGFGITLASTTEDTFAGGAPVNTAMLAAFTYEGSEIINNGSSLAQGPSLTMLAMAVDLDNNLIWFSEDEGSTWNYSSEATPGGTGGIDISAWRPVGTPVYFFAFLAAAGGYDNIAINSGQSAFVFPTPAGFSAGWPVA
jgi:hypothetical protein